MPGPLDPRPDHSAAEQDDLSIVPGMELDPVTAPPAPSGGLDMTQDPDRYVPSRDTAPAPPAGPLDMMLDPDRYRGEGDGRTLKELLGDGAFEEPRESWAWVAGLLGVLAFLALFTWLFGSVLSH